jgi:hypothetical protein
MIAPTIEWVVETGMPSQVTTMSQSAAAMTIESKVAGDEVKG